MGSGSCPPFNFAQAIPGVGTELNAGICPYLIAGAIGVGLVRHPFAVKFAFG